MTFSTFLSYAWLVSILLSAAVAADRNDPLIEAHKPSESLKFRFWQAIMLIWVVMLFALHFVDCPDILGQRPWLWGKLILVLYVWYVFLYYCFRKQ